MSNDLKEIKDYIGYLPKKDYNKASELLKSRSFEALYYLVRSSLFLARKASIKKEPLCDKDDKPIDTDVLEYLLTIIESYYSEVDPDFLN